MAYPLIKPYPLEESLPSEVESRIEALEEVKGFKSQRNKSPRLVIPGPYEHVQVATTGRGDDNTLPSLIDFKLSCLAAYRSAVDMTPPIGRLPCTVRYRDEHDRINSSNNLVLNEGAHTEVMNFGQKLPPGQVLFHGGPWCWSQTTGTFDRPLSTTLCARVARLHAEYHAPATAEIWIITVLPMANVMGLVLDRRGEHDLAHEVETLVQTGVLVDKRFTRSFGKYLVHDVNLVGAVSP